MINLDNMTDFEKARAYERVTLKARKTGREFAQRRAAKLRVLEGAVDLQGWGEEQWREWDRELDEMKRSVLGSGCL